MQAQESPLPIEDTTPPVTNMNFVDREPIGSVDESGTYEGPEGYRIRYLILLLNALGEGQVFCTFSKNSHFLWNFFSVEL
jgi:hypothetical protein